MNGALDLLRTFSFGGTTWTAQPSTSEVLARVCLSHTGAPAVPTGMVVVLAVHDRNGAAVSMQAGPAVNRVPPVAIGDPNRRRSLK